MGGGGGGVNIINSSSDEFFQVTKAKYSFLVSYSSITVIVNTVDI